MNVAPQHIKWVKNVNDRITNSAYISPDLLYIPLDRVITNSVGTFFCLQLNPKFKDSLNNVPIGDIILLHQRLNKQSVKCFTHLVTPIGYNVVPCPYQYNGWPGRWVKVIAMTGNQIANSIPVSQTMWPSMGFTGQMHDLSFMQGRIREIPPTQLLPKLQNDIWNKFQPYIV